MAEEKAEKKKFGGKKSGGNQKVGRFETDENGHYKWAGPRTEKGGSIYEVLSAMFWDWRGCGCSKSKSKELATADTG